MFNELHRFLFLTGCILYPVACSSVSNIDYDNPVIISTELQQKKERFSQYELDAIFRDNSREFARALDTSGDFKICCVLFHYDIKMLMNVFAHFEENVSQDVSKYGVVVQENEQYFIVNFWERYLENGQEKIDDYWYPHGELTLPTYRYLIDRESLGILEFVKAPS